MNPIDDALADPAEAVAVPATVALSTVDDGTAHVPGAAEPPGARRGGTLARGGAWNALAQFSPVVVNIALTPYVISQLGLARFGLYVLLLTVADFLATFDGGLYRSALRFFAVYVGKGDKAAATRLMTGVVGAVSGLAVVLFAILFLSADLLLSVFQVPQELRGEGEFLIRTLAVTIGLGILRGVFSAILNAHQRFAWFGLVTTFHYGLYATGVLVSLETGHGLRGIALTLVLQQLTAVVLLGIPGLRLLDRQEVGLPTAAERRDFVRFSSRAQVVGLADLFNLQSQPIIIGAFLNVSRVGLYSAGANFAHQLRRLPMNAINPANALLARTYAEHGEQATLAEFRRLQRIWVLGVTGWSAVASSAAFFGITAWLGEDFRLAGVCATLLLSAALLRLLTVMLTVYAQAIGHPEIEARSGVVIVVANLGLAFAFVVPFGIVGVAVASTVGQLAGLVYLDRTVRSRLGSHIPGFLGEVPWVAAAAAVGLTVVLELLVRPFVPQGPFGLLLCGAAAAPALVGYGLLAFGPRTSIAWVRHRLRPRETA